MNLPVNWLKQFVNIKEKPEEIAEKLTLSGSEVEKIIDNGAGLSKIIIGRIKSIEPHPDADKLQLAYVDAGRKKELKIVCGAKNIKAGQKVPVALLGGSVPGMNIEPRDIRGVKSQGMLCSQRELGIGDDHSGIFILPRDSKIGEDVMHYLELDDPVLELDITPNRPDCFSVRGLARETAALTGRKIKDASYKMQESGTPASSSINVDIQDKKLCPKYCARVIQGVNAVESPLWLQNRLRQMNIRPINTVVDVTNYLMMELGHPMHAFDANLLEGGTIKVRPAKKGEKILALDEKKYSLNPDMLVIADSKKPVAIAGIMGGQRTGVTKGTQNIVLESAVFDPVSVRKTSKSLGLRSESSARFEKGVDYQAAEEAIDAAAALIAKLSGGVVLRGIVSEGKEKIPLPAAIKLSRRRAESVLGVKIPVSKIKSILSSLGFKVSGKQALSVKVPSWRIHDISAPEDLIEEVGRIMDYNKLPKMLPNAELASPAPSKIHLLRRNLRDFLTSAGYTEIYTYSFYNESSVSLSGISKSKHYQLTNPVNDEYPYLRSSLEPWMLDKLSQNSSLLSKDSFQLFEIGKIFQKGEKEKWQAAVGFIDTKASDEDLYRSARGVIEYFLGFRVKVEKRGREYVCVSGKRDLAIIRLYPKGSVSGLRFRSTACVMLLDIEEMSELANKEKASFTPIPYYPSVERDIGVVVSSVVKYKDIESAIASFDPLIKKIDLFDVYHGLEGGASYALRITFLSTDRTLHSGEVDEILEKLKSRLKEKFKVSFR